MFAFLSLFFEKKFPFFNLTCFWTLTLFCSLSSVTVFPLFLFFLKKRFSSIWLFFFCFLLFLLSPFFQQKMLKKNNYLFSFSFWEKNSFYFEKEKNFSFVSTSWFFWKGEIFLCVFSVFLFFFHRKFVFTHFDTSFFFLVSSLFPHQKTFSTLSLLECLLCLFIFPLVLPKSICSLFFCLSVFSRCLHLLALFKILFFLCLLLSLCFLNQNPFHKNFVLCCKNFLFLFSFTSP